MSYDGRCGATREGPRARASGIVMWRGTCRSWPLKGFDHCEFHLTEPERQRFMDEKGKFPRHRP